MKQIDLQNPFGSPVFFKQTVTSTMDECRKLAVGSESAASKARSGSVILADFQKSGRGRNKRPWKTRRGESLMFTLFLEYPDFNAIPKALTLKTGLAAAKAIEELLPDFKDLIKIKWPNDLMLFSKKISGILAETEVLPGGSNEENGSARVYIGIGVNIFQKKFPKELQYKAASLGSMYREKFPDKEIPSFFFIKNVKLMLLEKILLFLYKEFLSDFSAQPRKKTELSWQKQLKMRLYKQGELVDFVQGEAESGDLVSGRLQGIGEQGELLIILHGETEPRPFINGELKVY